MKERKEGRQGVGSQGVGSAEMRSVVGGNEEGQRVGRKEVVEKMRGCIVAGDVDEGELRLQVYLESFGEGRAWEWSLRKWKGWNAKVWGASQAADIMMEWQFGKGCLILWPRPSTTNSQCSTLRRFTPLQTQRRGNWTIT